MANKAHALSRDELIKILTAYSGWTTTNGAAGGSTLIDDKLIGRNQFVPNKTILIGSGDARDETQRATVFDDTTGKITVDPAFNAQILAGTLFRIINLPTGSSISEILTIVLATFDLVNAMLILEETGGVVTTTGPGTEDVVYINNNPAGVFKPKVVKINFTNQTAAETVVVRTHHRDEDGGGLIKDSEVAFAGVQDPLLKNITLQPNRFGVDVTIERTAGVAKAYRWEVFTES